MHIHSGQTRAHNVQWQNLTTEYTVVKQGHKMCSDKTWPLNRLKFGPPIPQSEFLWFVVVKIASVSSEIDHWAGGNSPPNSSIGIFEPPCAQCTVVKQGHKNVQWQNLTTESTVVKQGHTMCSDKTWPWDRPKFHPHLEYMRSTALKNHDFIYQYDVIDVP